MKKSVIKNLVREAVSAKIVKTSITSIIREEIRAVKEGAMSDIDIIAQESPTFEEFVKRVQKEMPAIGEITPDVRMFLQTIYDEA
jgi:hypothetical protein